MIRIWEEYGFEILFWVSVVVLLFIFVVNIAAGKKGTYQDHTEIIWDLLNKPANISTRGNKSSGRGGESRGEAECRRVAEEYTGLSFPKCRPDFLKNEITGGHNLELDCFNEDLKIAIEYNGEQHYNYIPYFHKTKDTFYNVKYRDDMKKRLCRENGVRLIVVPYNVGNIRSYLETELQKMI